MQTNTEFTDTFLYFYRACLKDWGNIIFHACSSVPLHPSLNTNDHKINIIASFCSFEKHMGTVFEMVEMSTHKDASFSFWKWRELMTWRRHQTLPCGNSFQSCKTDGCYTIPVILMGFFTLCSQPMRGPSWCSTTAQRKELIEAWHQNKQ